MFIIDLFFILIILFFLAIIILPIVLIVYGVIKKKKKIVIATSTISLLILFICLGYNFLFPTKFPYVDKWIIGNSKENIIKVYGEPEVNGDELIWYYTGKDNGVFGTGLMDSPNRYYYRIWFDENGEAYKVEDFTLL